MHVIFARSVEFVRWLPASIVNSNKMNMHDMAFSWLYAPHLHSRILIREKNILIKFGSYVIQWTICQVDSHSSDNHLHKETTVEYARSLLAFDRMNIVG